MDEFELIERFFKRKYSDNDVVCGIGDDGAVMRPNADYDLVSVVDTLVADVHFPSSLRPRDIGYRAVAVNLSDIAAMGARPRWMTLALTLDAVDIEWLDGFGRGLFEAAEEFGVELVGGDTTGGTQIVISIQISGEVRAGCALLRSGAGEGDDIYVSGTLGDAAMGLTVARRAGSPSPSERVLQSRFARPSPRVSLGQALVGKASAAIDVSDGLYADLAKMLKTSGVGGEMNVESLPLSIDLQGVAELNQARILALSGGDDYELCFTCSPEMRSEIDQLAHSTGVTLSRIGVVRRDSGLDCLLDGDLVDYVDAGYSHF